jgi:hypothetical protein
MKGRYKRRYFNEKPTPNHKARSVQKKCNSKEKKIGLSKS